tara:strand:- start:30989 stop:31210 length:222 start_codon:yes stop_codon:yes gene_type:complete
MIVNTEDLTSEQLSHSKAINQHYMRKSLDGVKILIKTENPDETCYNGLTKYSHSEILTILAGEDWTKKLEVPE